MGAIRVTQGILTQRTLSNINSQLLRLARFQEQLATGRRVNRPSDDPVATRRAIEIQTAISQNERFISNITDARPHLVESETMIQQVVNIIHRAKELTLQAANDTNAQEQLNFIAIEIDQLLEAATVAANHRTNGRSIFAGTRTLSDAYSITRVAGEITAVTYQGNTQNINISVSPGLPVTINVSGSSVFQSTVDIFSTLIGIRDDLRAGNQVSLRTTRLDELDAALSQLLLSEAQFGAVSNRFDTVSSNTEGFVLELRIVLSDKVDADFVAVMVGFNTEQNAFTAALNAAARVLQPSLLDFIR